MSAYRTAEPQERALTFTSRWQRLQAFVRFWLHRAKCGQHYCMECDRWACQACHRWPGSVRVGYEDWAETWGDLPGPQVTNYRCYSCGDRW